MDPMKGRIHITSYTDGGDSVFSAPAQLLRADGGVTIEYLTDGDRTAVFMDAKEYRMEREGDLSLSARFAAGERSAMRIASDGLSGSVPLFTEFYNFECSVFTAQLLYFLGDEGAKQRFRLTIVFEPMEDA